LATRIREKEIREMLSLDADTHDRTRRIALQLHFLGHSGRSHLQGKHEKNKGTKTHVGGFIFI